ncbi:MULTISPECIES: cell wall-binding protein [Clostridium]|uniref:cell wall-binding protein n=1 Tax=Clostridium TaxID=1485 RepID=UPI001494D634|nr:MULTISPECIES: cell wall-binding protein [Clostridium]NOW92304.1 glucan-binding YG repeat protein [Clostridium beijerinckii]
MKNFKRLIASFVTLITILAATPLAAHAEWKNNSTGWWYTEGNSWATGWRYIDGNWYYFYSNGYMAKNCYIGDYYLRGDGAWTTPPSDSSSSSGSTASNTNTSNDQSQTVYVSKNGIYHSSPNAHGMKYYTTMSLADAQKAGYRACEKCY